jgi:hypothetical protein
MSNTIILTPVAELSSAPPRACSADTKALKIPVDWQIRAMIRGIGYCPKNEYKLIANASYDDEKLTQYAIRCMVSKGLSSETATFRDKLRISSRSAFVAERELALSIVYLSCLITEEASVMVEEMDVFDLLGEGSISDTRLKLSEIESRLYPISKVAGKKPE